MEFEFLLSHSHLHGFEQTILLLWALAQKYIMQFGKINDIHIFTTFYFQVDLFWNENFPEMKALYLTHVVQ